MALDSTMVADIVRKAVLVTCYICTSTGMIRFNKYLMAEGRFPYSMALTSLHMAFSSVFCILMYAVKPSLFPGMEATAGKRSDVLKWFVPIGVAFAVSLYASNQAYFYCSVTFLQFLKEGNAIITFMMSVAAGLQVLSGLRVAIIVWVVTGCTLAISGEVHFMWIGFVFQVVSQIAECSRATMGEYVLSGASFKLDPLSYTMFVSPTCLFVLLSGSVMTWESGMPMALMQWWPVLIPNACMAFLLNVICAYLIKECSAVGFILCGVVKDVFVVLVSALAMGETVTPVQVFGFGLTLGGIFSWSFAKVAPDSDIVRRAEAIFGGVPRKGA